jgi:alpha-1,3-mannosyltransferase
MVPASSKTARRTRVLHVVRQFPPSVGGLEAYVSTLASLQSENATVVVLTLDRLFSARQRLQRIERMGRVIVVRVPFIGLARLFLPFFGPALLRRFDIVHVHALDQFTDLASLWRLLGAPPFVVTSHGLFFHTAALAGIKRWYFRLISKRTLARAAAVFAISRTDQAKLAEIAIASKLLPNPVTPLPLLYSGGRDLIYWGRIAENKAVPKLVAFLTALHKIDPGRKLHIVGSGDPAIKADLMRRIDASGLLPHIICHDYLAHSALEQLITRCGHAVSASRYEGYGMAQVEAMSAGLLPVMHPNSAFRELHEAAGCGLLVDFDDPDAAARSFLDWEAAQTPSDRANARAFALSRSWGSVAQEIDAVYRGILAAHPVAGRRSPQEGYASC